MEEKWLEVWHKNYANESAMAKNIMAFSKQTYKGDTYLPWALMVGALYQLDPNAKITKVVNDKGGYVFTDEVGIKTINAGVETYQTVVSHMVRVDVSFMGKVFTDVYPIQEKDYSASKVYDQNKVNKAQQRCLTRVISMATGIGWSIYEQTEAQFEDDKKPEVLKPITKVVPTVVEDSSVVETVNNPIIELATFIIDNKENSSITTLLNNYNEVLQKKYVDEKGNAIILSTDDTFDVLVSKISVLDNPDKMLKGLKKAIGGK